MTVMEDKEENLPVILDRIIGFFEEIGLELNPEKCPLSILKDLETTSYLGHEICWNGPLKPSI